MDYAVSRARLKNYFSTVTYIDDRFDHCIIDEPLDFGDEETVDTRLSPYWVWPHLQLLQAK